MRLYNESHFGSHGSLWFFALALYAAVMACGDRTTVFGNPTGGGGQDVGTGAGGEGGTGGEGVPPVTKTERIDLLLAIDNSRSMADKQEILSLAIPSLLHSFVNPICLDQTGLPVDEQPSNASQACPEGSERQFPAITDIHVGVITSSLGGHGSDNCSNNPSEDDQAHLITRGPQDATVGTYQELGFLAWDPTQQKTPPGEINLSNLQTNLKALVLGAGQVGCGFEASLESWYRFLIEPSPHETVIVEKNVAKLEGIDEVLLEQRKAFLRPDSLLLVTLLSDENDCSIRDGGQYFFAARSYLNGSPYHLPRPRAACAADPNDPCCRSCGQQPGAGCSTALDDCGGAIAPNEDHINLRCWQQKRRFGIDFLYPVQRYVDGLTQPEIADRNGEIVKNPLFRDLDPDDAIEGVRDERLVYFTSLVGVPWQDIARRNNNGVPDLKGGLDSEGLPRGAFQSGEELAENGTWDLIIGEPAQYFSDPGAVPADPLMLESVDPRTGIHPLTGEPVAPPGAAPWANSINGHEYTVPSRGDLQYACIFPLIQPRDCTVVTSACACKDPNNDNPLCQSDSGAFTQTQYKAKAYPGIRQLEVARGLSERAVVASICPAQLKQAGAADFGYEPLVTSLVNAVAPALDRN